MTFVPIFATRVNSQTAPRKGSPKTMLVCPICKREFEKKGNRVMCGPICSEERRQTQLALQRALQKKK